MNTSSTAPLKPMGWLASLLYFGVPAAILYASVYVVIPALEHTVLAPMMAYFIGLLIPLIGLFAAALIAFRLEGNPFTWTALRERFRLHRMTRRMWLWAIGLSVFGLIATGLFTGISRALIDSGITPLPSYIPVALDPRVNQTDPQILSALVGGQIQGNWPIAAVYFVLLFFNIIGEEFWWRGYILPRQELAFGRWTWLVHGLLWCLFHAFKYFDYLSILPVTLAIPYVSQRLKNNTPAIIAHYVVNGVGWLGIFLLVLGVVKL